MYINQRWKNIADERMDESERKNCGVESEWGKKWTCQTHKKRDENKEGGWREGGMNEGSKSVLSCL